MMSAATSGFRSARLEALFGAPFEHVTAEHIGRLVASGASEAFDLEFKERLYGSTDQEKRDLAGDVAALANTAGGIIVIGVAEDKQGCAASAPGVDLSDGERVRMLQVVANKISPLPSFDVLAVPCGERDLDAPDSGPRGYFLITVAPSTRAPHGVIVNDGFRFPRRNGSSIRYLSEPEIAAAYRDRFAGAAARRARMEEVSTLARERLDRDQRLWVLACLVPEIAGGIDVTHESVKAFQARNRGRDVLEPITGGSGTTFRRIGVRQGCFIADGGYGVERDAWASAAYHRDGAGTYALEIVDMVADGAFRSLPPQASVVLDDQIVIAVLTSLTRLARFAHDEAGAGGAVALRLCLVPRNSGGPIFLGNDRSGIVDWGPDPAPGSSVVDSETVASLAEVATSGTAVVAAAARLVAGLGQAFGVAELGQISAEGEIRLAHWSPFRRQSLTSWAERLGVPLSTDILA